MCALNNLNLKSSVFFSTGYDLFFFDNNTAIFLDGGRRKNHFVVIGCVLPTNTTFLI